MLGHSIGGRADLAEQTGSGGSIEQIAAPPFDHAGHHGAGGIDVGHQVDIPNPLPFFVAVPQVAIDGNPGVGAEQIDGAGLAFCGLDQIDDVALYPDIGGDGDAANFFGDGRDPGFIQVGDDDLACAFGGETLGQGPANAAGPARHNNNFIPYLHFISPVLI